MYQLPKDLVEEIIRYLGTRPYIEVVQLIAGIGNACQKQAVEDAQKAKAAKEVKKE